MFKKTEPRTGLPSIADLQTAAQIPGKVVGYLKIALLIWGFFWILGSLLRIAGTVKLMRRERIEGNATPETARPVYALFSFTFYGGSNNAEQ